jgi:hypothetical protein
MDVEVHSFARELESRNTEYDEFRRQRGVTREAVFLQRGAQGSQLITYREFDDSASTQPISDGAFGSWLKERMSVLHGFDATATPQPKVELLVRQRLTRRSKIYAATLPLLTNKTARLHEWAMELSGIHAAEFDEGLGRLGHAVTLFVQHTPQLDLVISVVEGDEPSSALRMLARSEHPFDRWHIQQIAELSGLDFSGPPPPPNELLWSWDGQAVRGHAE